MGVLGPWAWAKYGWAPSPPASPQCPWCPLHPCWPTMSLTPPYPLLALWAPTPPASPHAPTPLVPQCCQNPYTSDTPWAPTYLPGHWCPLHPLLAPNAPWCPYSPCCCQCSLRSVHPLPAPWHPYTPATPMALTLIQSLLLPMPPTPEQKSSCQEWYYFRWAWHVISLWVRLQFCHMYTPPSLIPLNAPQGEASGGWEW